MIRVLLPQHLQILACAPREAQLEINGPITQRTILNALEEKYPALRGTLRYHDTQKRRALVRFFACQEDLSNESPDAPVPEKVVGGVEPFIIIGAVAGG